MEGTGEGRREGGSRAREKEATRSRKQERERERETRGREEAGHRENESRNLPGVLWAGAEWGVGPSRGPTRACVLPRQRALTRWAMSIESAGAGGLGWE